MALYEAKCAFDVGARLGECATWSVAEQAFYWADIHGQSISRLDPATGARRDWALPAAPGCFALTGDGALVIAAQDGVHRLDTATGALSLLQAPPYDPAVFRFNDGALDRQGRFWFGSMFADFRTQGIEAAKGRGTYYRYDGRALIPGFPGVTMPNGTAFSPDGRTMYRAETYDRAIWAYDYDIEAGMPSNGRVFARTPEEFGLPDGATVDADGGYWSAMPMGGWILRFDRSGALVGQYKVPTARPTMCTFGGPDLTTLYITSMTYPEAVDAGDVHAGAIFTMETDVQGLPAPLFQSRP